MGAKEGMSYSVPECDIPKNKRESEENCFTNEHVALGKKGFPDFSQLKGAKNENENIQSFLKTLNDSKMKSTLLGLKSKEDMLNTAVGNKLTQIPEDFAYKNATIHLAWETIVNIQREYDGGEINEKEVYGVLGKFNERRDQLKDEIENKSSK